MNYIDVFHLIKSFFSTINKPTVCCVNPFRPAPARREKTNLNFYVQTSWWYFKRFCEGLKGLNFNLIQLTEMNETGRFHLKVMEGSRNIGVFE